jgi:hypothetical protein
VIEEVFAVFAGVPTLLDIIEYQLSLREASHP